MEEDLPRPRAPPASRGVIPKALLASTHMGNYKIAAGLIQVGAGGDSRHVFSGQITRRLVGGRVARAGPPVKNVNQSRRLLSLAGVRDGMDRGAAARSGAWTARRFATGFAAFKASGPEGLLDNWTEGPKPRLSAQQVARVAQIVEAGRSARETGSCAGGVSISSASSPSGSASTSTSAMSGRF